MILLKPSQHQIHFILCKCPVLSESTHSLGFCFLQHPVAWQRLCLNSLLGILFLVFCFINERHWSTYGLGHIWGHYVSLLVNCEPAAFQIFASMNYTTQEVSYPQYTCDKASAWKETLTVLSPCSHSSNISFSDFINQRPNWWIFNIAAKTDKATRQPPPLSSQPSWLTLRKERCTSPTAYINW